MPLKLSNCAVQRPKIMLHVSLDCMYIVPGNITLGPIPRFTLTCL